MSTRDGNGEIYTVNPDGSEMTNITNDLLDDRQLAWSPDGMQLAFAKVMADGFTDIFAIDWDGADPQNITQTTGINEFDPAWSPSGSRLVIRRLGSPTDLFTLNMDGSGVVRITNGTLEPQQPRWSRIGNEILFTNDFSGLRRVPALGGTVTSVVADGSLGKWSPVDDRIVYLRTAGNQDLFALDLQAGGPTQLTNTGEEFEPFWFPDGTKILFVSLRDFNEKLYTMNPDGTNQTKISGELLTDTDSKPSLSPDGSEVAFIAGRDPTGGVFKLNTNGTGEDVLSLETTAIEVAWSPCQP